MAQWIKLDYAMANCHEIMKENHENTLQMVSESIKECHMSLKGVADQITNL